jgi:hypothetical protein
MDKTQVKHAKVLLHPDKEEIIKKLLDGVSLKKIELWLKKKYPKRTRLHISWVTLQKFRTEHLNLHGEVLEDIKVTKKLKDSESIDQYTKDVIAKSSHYQNKINEIASSELDATKRLLEMDKLINSRLVYYFNLLESGKGEIREDKVFLEYIKEYRAILESWKKFVEGHADKKIEHNINISVVNEQVNVLKGIIFEVLQEMSPQLVPAFVDKLNSRLGLINVGTEEYKRLGYVDAEFTDD